MKDDTVNVLMTDLAGRSYHNASVCTSHAGEKHKSDSSQWHFSTQEAGRAPAWRLRYACHSKFFRFTSMAARAKASWARDGSRRILSYPRRGDCLGRTLQPVTPANDCRRSRGVDVRKRKPGRIRGHYSKAHREAGNSSG